MKAVRCSRRIPKRGFNNIFATKYATVNVSDLNKFKDGTVVDTELVASGLVKVYDGVKILGNGELTANLTVRLLNLTERYRKIEKAGGKAEVSNVSRR